MSLACNVDAAAWGASNRVELYPDQRQTWVLATVLDRGTPDDLDVKRQARAVMARWFSDAPITDLGARSGAADNIEVGRRPRCNRWLPGPSRSGRSCPALRRCCVPGRLYTFR